MKAGIARAEEEDEGTEGEDSATEEGAWNPEGNPMHAVLEMKLSYKWDREEAALERELGRDLTQEEKNGIYAKLQIVRGLSVKEAFTLTPAYAKIAKAAEDKRVEAAIKKLPPGRRPPPPNAFSSGQKIDLKKDVRQLGSDEEKAAVIRDILDANG